MGAISMRKRAGYFFAICALLVVSVAEVSSFDIAYAGGGTETTQGRLAPIVQCLSSGGRWGRVAVYEYNGVRRDDKFECVESSDRCKRSEFPCRATTQTFIDNRWPVQCCRPNQTCHPEQKAEVNKTNNPPGWTPPRLCWDELRYIPPYKKYRGPPL